MADQSAGDAAQTRIIVEQVADALEARRQANKPRPQIAEIPAALKTWGTIAAAVAVAVFSAGCIWLVTSVNTMQITLARMEERLAGQADTSDSRLIEIDRRVQTLEAYHAKKNGE